MKKFTIKVKEARAAVKWANSHKCSAPKKYRDLTFQLKGQGGIGISVDIVCSCGKKKDITDYGCW